MVDYGRPLLRGRASIFGNGARLRKTISDGSAVWRMGANDSTRFTTQVPLEIGGKTLAPGVFNFASARSRLTAALARPPAALAGPAAAVAGPAAAHRGRASATMGTRLSAARSHLSNGGERPQGQADLPADVATWPRRLVAWHSRTADLREQWW